MFKDEILADLSKTYNVAKFKSYAPTGEERFDNTDFPDLETFLKSVGSVNVRTFDPASPKSRPFVYGITDLDSLNENIQKYQKEGLYIIVNETIDINDGGVSGVIYDNKLIEFSPKDTPRCVEKEGVCSLPFYIGAIILNAVYGVNLQIFPHSKRIEFSIHPNKVGCKNEQILIWETEKISGKVPEPNISYPNNFSRFIGDKVFGLLVAYAYNFLVPHTFVIGRNVAPFWFGYGTGEQVWIRTAPFEPVAGKYTTQKGWTDPFKLLQDEDSDGKTIVSVLAQDGVAAKYSGVCAGTDKPVIEGVKGYDDNFMLGSQKPVELPNDVKRAVGTVWKGIKKRTKTSPRFEWVYSGDVYIVQLHLGECESEGNVIVKGTPAHWMKFDPNLGLEALRDVIKTIKKDEGIMLTSKVGVLSHFGDVLRKAKIISRIEAR